MRVNIRERCSCVGAPLSDQPPELETTRDLAVLATWEQWTDACGVPHRHGEMAHKWAFEVTYGDRDGWVPSGWPGERPWTRYVPERKPKPATLGDVLTWGERNPNGSIKRAKRCWGAVPLTGAINTLYVGDIEATDWLVSTDGETWVSPDGWEDAPFDESRARPNDGGDR